MTADLIVVVVVVGLLAGRLADVAMNGGGYGGALIPIYAQRMLWRTHA